MPPKKKNNLKIINGQVELIQVECNDNSEKETAAPKPRTRATRAKKKPVVEPESCSDEADDEIDIKECESRLLVCTQCFMKLENRIVLY